MGSDVAAAWYFTDHEPNAGVQGRLEFLEARVIKMVIDWRGIVKKRDSKRVGVSAEQRRRYTDYFGSSSIFVSFSLSLV